MPSREVKVEGVRDRNIRKHEPQYIENLSLYISVGERFDALGIIALKMDLEVDRE